MNRNKDQAVSSIIGTLLMLGIVVTMAAIVAPDLIKLAQDVQTATQQAHENIPDEQYRICHTTTEPNGTWQTCETVDTPPEWMNQSNVERVERAGSQADSRADE